MNIFLHELRSYRKSTFIWSLSLIVLVLLFMSFYPSFSKDAENFTKIMESYPETVRNLIGVNLSSFFTILGFYSFLLTFITLCGAVQSMNLGTSIISKEAREKTADFLLTKPVTRKTVMTAKLLAAFASLVITNVLYLTVASIVTIQVKNVDFNYKVFILLSLTLFFVQLIFLAIGFMVSVLVPKMKSVLPVSLGTVFAFYFLGMFSGTAGEEARRYVSPFKYFDTFYIMKHASYERSFLIAGAVIIMISIITSFIVYTKKDIHTV